MSHNLKFCPRTIFHKLVNYLIWYADDTSLSTSFNTLSKTTLTKKTTETIINEERSKINEGLNINKLLLNKSKSKYMVFHMPNKHIRTLTFKIDDADIVRVDEFYFLGLTLYTNLNWRTLQINVQQQLTY